MDMLSLIILAVLSLIMGFVNSIAGGGGVFGVPAMMAMGIPPVNALALNRFADIGNILGSLRNYMRIEDFRAKFALLMIPPLLIGAIAGAHFVVGLDDSLREKIILGAVAIGIIFLLYPVKPKDQETKPHLIIGILAILVLGFWDGAFAMAGGTFGVLILALLFGRSYIGAKSIMTAAAVPETLLTVTILWFHSTLTWMPIVIMIGASIIGAYAGSKMAIKRGSSFIRYAMIVMAIVMAGKVLLFDVLEVF